MSDTETRFFVQAFVRFLNKQIVESGMPADTAESLEVAVQCLETAYNLPVEMTSSADAGAGPSADPMTHTDLHQLFQAACAAHPDRKLEAERIKNEGNALMREEKYEEALLSYNRAIALDASNPVFYCNRAATYSRLGDFQKAAEDCKLSLRYDPTYSKAYGRLGIAYAKLNQHEASVDAYKMALELEPNNMDYLNNLKVATQQLEESKQQTSSHTPAGTAQPDAGPGIRPTLGLQAIQALAAQPGMQHLINRVVNNPAQMNIIFDSIRSRPETESGQSLSSLLNSNIDLQALLSQLGGGFATNSSADSSPSNP